MLADRYSARTALQGIGICCVSLMTIAVIYADVLVLENVLGEGSLVEWCQALLILGSAVFFAIGARRHQDLRGYLILVSALFLCMYVRENDGVLDHIVHGFWRAPVLAIVIVAALLGFQNRKTIRPALAQHMQDSSFWILTVGFFQHIIFSRLFGSGKLWKSIPGQADLTAAKSIVQEGTELVSYALIFFGAYLSYRYLFGARQSLDTEKTIMPPAR